MITITVSPNTLSGSPPDFVAYRYIHEGAAGRPAVRPLHVFPIPPSQCVALLSSPPTPSSLYFSAHSVFLSVCPLNWPLDFLLVSLLASSRTHVHGHTYWYVSVFVRTLTEMTHNLNSISNHKSSP